MEPLFNSFFIGGFECADHINRSGQRIDLLAETEHDIRADADYELLYSIGIRTVREGIRWSVVERIPGQYDFSELLNRMRAATNHGIQILWDLCHFGYPDDLSPTHPLFHIRFAKLCRAFAEFWKANSDQILFVTPINEISFLSWHSGDMRGTVPFAVHSGWDIKYHLCRAAIEGIKALKQVDPNCRVMLVEPIIKVHARHEDDEHHHINNMNQDQFQAMDIISGRICSELGGSPEFLDILGFNYYYNNQWKFCEGALNWWPEKCPDRVSFAVLLEEAWKRYNKPVVLSETGHFGDSGAKARWMEEIGTECMEAIRAGVDLRGVCIYPVIDRPDWDNLDDYSRCGLWDLDQNKNRVPDHLYLEIFSNISGQFDQLLSQPAEKQYQEHTQFSEVMV